MKLIVLILCLPLFAFARQQEQEKSADLAEAGFSFYYFADYAKAESLLGQASRLEPKNSDYRLGYAKALIKTGKSDQALQVLHDLQKQEPKPGLKQDREKARETERTFLIGLVQYNQGQNRQAAASFTRVANSAHSLKAPAENYLQRIEDEEKRYSADVRFGLMYDSQVIDEDLISTTAPSDGRLFMSGNVDRLLKKTGKGQWHLRGEAANYFSFKDDHSLADPLMIAIRAPYTTQTTLLSKDLNLLLQPSLEIYWLDIDNSGSRELFLTTLAVDLFASRTAQGDSLNAFHATARLDLGQADSLEGTSADIDGVNLLGGWKHTRLLQQGRLWQSDVYAKLNLASGDNIKFYRAGGSYAYLLPFKKWDAGVLAEGRLTLYPDHTAKSRNDIYLSAAAVASRSIADLFGRPQLKWLALELKTGYALNMSNADERDYNRLVVSSLLRGHWKF